MIDSELCAVALCLSVCLSVTSRRSVETAEQDMEAWPALSIVVSKLKDFSRSLRSQVVTYTVIVVIYNYSRAVPNTVISLFGRIRFEFE